VLRRTAEVLRENCREYDYVARMGGDEFVVVLPGSSHEAVQARIKVLAEAARTAGKEAVGKDLLAMSIGQASYPADGTDAEQLLAEADRRMYKVKQTTKAIASAAAAWDLTRLDDSLVRQSRVADDTRAAVLNSRN
jgi:diguanylate cyclase (GGDEF)-like protein